MRRFTSAAVRVASSLVLPPVTTLPHTSEPPPAAALNRGLSNGIEIAVVTMLFCFAGFGLDKWLGTSPIFTIVLSFVGIAGVFARAYYTYKADMERHEAARRAPRVGQAS